MPLKNLPPTSPTISAQILPLEMAERLRAARAELEAEFESDEAAISGPDEAAAVDAATDTTEAVDAFEQNGDASADGPGFVRRRAGETRYVRQSANLPRITETPSENAESLTSMAGFRARMLRSKAKDTD